MQTEELLTRQQVAKLLHCSPHFIDQLRQNKGLPYLKLVLLVVFEKVN